MSTAFCLLRTDLADMLGSENVRVHEPVARYTTWRVGGLAALLCVARSVDGLLQAVECVRAAGVPCLVLGRGSNVLCDDRGMAGVVILNRATGLEIQGTAVRAESGVLLGVLARETVRAGLAGLEWCHDIPGTVGGAVVNNAGANGGDVAGALSSVRVLAGGAVRAWAACELAFGYRHSILREEAVVPAGARPLVLEACCDLRAADVTEIKRRMSAQRERRKATQPGGASAGSVFKNPAGDSAGRLVESVGLKGARCGGAAVSTLHANFIVTSHGATAADVLALVALARQRVREEHGILLEPEVQLVRHDGRIGPPLLEDV